VSDQGDELRGELDRLRRRQRRNERAAFARGLLQGIRSMLGPGDVAIDCGANVGAVTLPLAETGATVHAFEPDPYAFPELEARVAGLPNVRLHRAAVGVSSGRVRLMRAANFAENPKGGSVKSTVVPGGRRIAEDAGAGIEVEMVCLPEVIRGLAADHGRVAFLKLDIEGAELDLLEHMEAEGLFDLVRLTLAETHERKFPALRPRFAALRERIAAAHPVTRVNLDWV
jgi:FkbM family methyltransferase